MRNKIPKINELELLDEIDEICKKKLGDKVSADKKSSEKIEHFVKTQLKPNNLYLCCPHCKEYFDVDEQTLEWHAKHTIIQWMKKQDEFGKKTG